MSGFLYVQSEYSFLNSMNKISDYVSLAKSYGYKSINITDPNMHGAYKFYKECIKNDIKPIIGLKITIRRNANDYILLAYALNNLGYKNLLKISSRQSLKGYVELEYLMKIDGVLFTTPGVEGEVEQHILNGAIVEAKNALKSYKGLKNFYVGISLNNELFYDLAKLMYDLANSFNLPCLPINRCLYEYEEDKENYTLFRSIEDSNIKKLDGSYHLIKEDALIDLFKGFAGVIDNYIELEKAVDIKIERVKNTLPKYPDTRGKSSKEFLRDLCFLGLKIRLSNNPINKYIVRLNYELEVISKMNFDDYFLIVYDFIKYAKKNNILVGPGRGSAAGSLVSYCLGITNIDPIKFNLMFERFLNPERITMPDIDIDFPDDKRDEVIKYVQKKYGEYNVCHIATFQRFKAKMAIRDMAKVLGIDQNITKAISNLTDNFETISELINAYPNIIENENTNKLLNAAKSIEGLPRQMGTHAAGIIISSDPLIENIAILKGIDDLYQSQFEASDLEELGLLKIDFLGLSNLSTIKRIIEDININIFDIPLNDKNTFELLSRADTLGVFQLESYGIRNVLRKIKPTRLSDLIAVLALYRPGPMDQIDEFIERKHGKPYTLIDESIKEVLKPTYGIIVYQEQIIQICNIYANYSLGEADVLRRAVSKKKLDVLEAERIKFVKKSVENNKNEADANNIYDYIVKFADYGFNKNHATAYSIISYQMAYLKANYFPQFMCQLLNDSIGVKDKVQELILECKKKNVTVLPPDINISTDLFIYKNNKIYSPFSIIKGFGINNCKKIIEERNNSNFKSFVDFKNRVNFSKDMLYSLVYSGAFDLMGTKKSLIKNSDEDFEIILESFSDLKVLNDDEFDNLTLLEKEKEALGFNLKYSLFDRYNDIIKKENLKFISEAIENNGNYICAVENVKEITTKKGEQMAFVVVSDNVEKIEAVMFAKCYKQLKNELKHGIILKVRAKIEVRDGKKSIIIDDAIILGK